MRYVKTELDAFGRKQIVAESISLFYIR